MPSKKKKSVIQEVVTYDKLLEYHRTMVLPAFDQLRLDIRGQFKEFRAEMNARFDNLYEKFESFGKSVKPVKTC